VPCDSLDDWIDKACEADALPTEEPEEPQGPRLTLDELQTGRAFLVQWQSPATFSATTKAMCNRCRSADYFNQPKLKFLHDAHVLAEFVQLKEVEAVRLAGPADQWPDGFLRLGG